MANNEQSKNAHAKTSAGIFGGTARICHDSASFYSRRMFESGPAAQAENEVTNDIGRYQDAILCRNSADLKDVPDSSVHLMVTSPPYNVGKAYDDDLSLGEYFDMLDCVFAETYRLLVNGGRACINIANVGRKPYIPYHSFIISLMLKNKFLMRGEIIWEKGAKAGTSTAWGSWMSAANPTLRDTHEYILIFSKGKFDRRNGGKSTISRDEFLEYTKSVWSFGPESAKRVNHPAPYPIELPYRCIQLYTFEGDIVFDPFCGSGSSAIAAIRSGRGFLMVDSSKEYTGIAGRRVNDELCQTKR